MAGPNADRVEKLMRMAKAFESPAEAETARRMLIKTLPADDPLRQSQEWGELFTKIHGNCPGCKHAENKHAGGACYSCHYHCGWSPLGKGNAWGLPEGWFEWRSATREQMIEWYGQEYADRERPQRALRAP